jgi:uncharacterized protein YjeT (DUF2065 family)
MNWFYLSSSALFTLFGLILTIYPPVGRKLMQFVIGKELQLIPGTFEIGIGLATLYYRDQTNFKWFVYLVGLLLFFDGILYLLSTRRLRTLAEMVLMLENKTWRHYGYLTLILALGYLMAAIK